MLGSAKLKLEEEKKKKAWTTPTLTVLVRRKPEEGVLVTCKGEDTAGFPENAESRCTMSESECPSCQGLVAS